MPQYCYFKTLLILVSISGERKLKGQFELARILSPWCLLTDISFWNLSRSYHAMKETKYFSKWQWNSLNKKILQLVNTSCWPLQNKGQWFSLTWKRNTATFYAIWNLCVKFRTLETCRVYFYDVLWCLKCSF